jgi:hypothetical protein
MFNEDFDCFFNTDEFAETILYKPYGGGYREVKAIVTREKIETTGEEIDVGRKKLQIEIANDSSIGILSVRKGKDKFKIPLYEGGKREVFIINQIITRSGNIWKLEVTG